MTADERSNSAAAAPDVERLLQEAAAVDLSWIVPPPTADGWTLAPDALRFVTAVVRALRPRHVLEMGSGLSTRLLAREAAALGNGCVISSVDHDPQYNWETSPRESADGSAANVAFHLAPLVVREFGGKLGGAYLIRPDKLASKAPVDLVVIDGPPVNLGGREATLYQVMDYARPGTLVLLDDSKRPEERAAIRAWQDNLGDAITVSQLPGFAKGMAMAVIHRPVRTAEFWQHRFDLSRAEIERHVPAGEPLIIAGESWWALELETQRTVFPLMEHDGQYWGEPADDAAAIAEVEKLKRRGARFIAFGWPTFWWLTHYRDFVATLGRRVVENDRLVLFELGGDKA
jgi:predicted O-methyltransferase YrrM